MEPEHFDGDSALVDHSRCDPVEGVIFALRHAGRSAGDSGCASMTTAGGRAATTTHRRTDHAPLDGDDGIIGRMECCFAPTFDRLFDAGKFRICPGNRQSAGKCELRLSVVHSARGTSFRRRAGADTDGALVACVADDHVGCGPPVLPYGRGSGFAPCARHADHHGDAAGCGAIWAHFLPASGSEALPKAAVRRQVRSLGLPRRARRRR